MSSTEGEVHEHSLALGGGAVILDMPHEMPPPDFLQII
jgi:hypothetical protein